MPFTPFHLGVGAVCKAGLGDRFSFMVFGGSQILMDIEPGIKLLTGAAPLHGPTHTLGGALVIGFVAALIGKPISEFVLKLHRFKDAQISWSTSALAAFTGTLSHIVLDAVMHADMHPWSPVAQSNGLLGLMTIDRLHLFCLALCAVGALGVWVRTGSTSKQADGRRSG